jgi:hypothetical protein
VASLKIKVGLSFPNTKMGEVSGYLTMEGKEPITILDKAQ